MIEMFMDTWFFWLIVTGIVFILSWFYVWRKDKVKAIKAMIKGYDQ